MKPLRRTQQSYGFARLLRAEFTKFRSVRAWMVALCATAVVFILIAYVSALENHERTTTVPSFGGAAVTDSYTFVRRTLVGDGALTAQVTSLSGRYGPQLDAGLAPWSKAGIILEPDTNQGTEYAAVMVTGSHGIRMQYDYTHDSPGVVGAVSPSSARWLRLTRAGDIIAAYDSTDGVHWSEVGSTGLSGLTRKVQIGLFVTSPVYFASGVTEGTPSIATAAFDRVAAQGVLFNQSWAGSIIAGLYPYPPETPTWQQQSADSFVISGSGDIGPLVGGTVFTHWSGASIVNGTIVALLMVIVLAAAFATAEYRRGLIRTTLAADPRRGQVLAAKAAVAGTLAFAAGTLATAASEAITRHVLADNGNYLFPQSGPALARVMLGTGVFLGLAAALVVALGAMLRRTAWAVLAGVALLIVPGVLDTTLPIGSGNNWLMQFTPTAAFAIQATLPRSSLVSDAYIPANGYFPISPLASLAVLAAYSAAALAAAAWLLHRRDA